MSAPRAVAIGQQTGRVRRRRPIQAFTLTELLAVLAVIAVMVGTVGVAWRAPRGASGLAAAQTTLAGLCRATRLQAVLAGRNARLVVGAEPGERGHYLRRLQIVVEDPDQPGRWFAAGGGVSLPEGVYAVPGSTAAVPGNPAWPAARCSTALPAVAQPLTVDGVAAGLHYFLQFSPRGTTGGGNLVVTPGLRAGDRLAFENPDDVRGILVRPSGAITLLDGPGAFGP